MKRSTSYSRLLMAMAAMGAMPIKVGEPDHSVRDANRMKLTPEESSHLETLFGREKKAYVKQLRNKYNGVSK